MDINWLFATTDGAGNYVATSSSWPQAWSAVDIQEALPNDGDACAIIGLLYRRLEFSTSFQTQTTDHIDLARHRVLHLCSRELPQCSLSAHESTDIGSSIVCAGSSPGSLIHNGFPSPSSIYCAQALHLRHMAFQIRDQSDEVVHLSGHSVSFEIVIARPFE